MRHWKYEQCAHCGRQGNFAGHCTSHTCRWIRCLHCQAVNDTGTGKYYRGENK